MQSDVPGNQAGSTSLPLEGIRVVDFTLVWAGPFATQILADLGAEVIKVENIHIWQTATRGLVARPTKQMLEAALPIHGGYPDNEPGDRPWNRFPGSLHLFRNKKSVTVDATRPEGVEVVKRLVAISDIFYENNATGTMEKLGLTYEILRSVRPDLIYARVPAYGSTGQYANYRALGVHIEGVLGHTLLRGYRDTGPEDNTTIYTGDYFAGAQGAFAVMAALNHRRRTGQGQLVELAQAEAGTAMFAEAILDWIENRRLHTPIGNRDIHGAAPSGVYPAAGEDRWVAISCRDDGEWAGLVAAIGYPDWALDEKLRTVTDRRARQDEIDLQLAEWTRDRDDHVITELLQRQGVPCGPVLSAEAAHADPHLAERGFFRDVTTVDIGTRRFPGPLFGLSQTPVADRTPPVGLGEHNEYVYKELLGYSDDEYAQFERDGHIGESYDPTIP
jgi:crotonobetainyl-CoA:carnitine CoA-transferase CaiB-like acyl-CoA transferase